MSNLSFDIECLACNKKLHCPMSAVGKKVKCPKCGAMMLADPLQTEKGAVPIPQAAPQVEQRKSEDTILPEDESQDEGDPIVLYKTSSRPWVAVVAIAILLIILSGTFLLLNRPSHLAVNETKAQPTRAEPVVEPNKEPEPLAKNDVKDQFPLLKARGIQAEETTPPDDKDKLVSQDAITALALWTEYEENIQAAENKYRNKLVKVTGTVHSVTKNERGVSSISLTLGTLEGGEKEPSIYCEMRESAQAAVAEVKKNMVVTIQCKPMEMKDQETARKGLALYCVDATLVK